MSAAIDGGPPDIDGPGTERYFEARDSKGNFRGRAVRGAAARVLAQSFSSAIQFTSGVVLARLLVPEDFGLVAMVTAYSMVLVDVGALRLSTAVVQAQRVTHRQVSVLFWVNAGLSALMGLLFALLAPLLVWVYDEPRLQWIALVISLSFVFRGLATQHQALLSRSMRFVDLAVLDISGMAVSVGVAIAMAWLGWGYWALVARRVVAHAVTACGAWVLCGWRPGFYLRAEGTGSLIKFGLHTIGAQTLQGVSADRMLIGWQYGAGALGLYDRAQQLFVFPFNQLTSPLSSVVVSALSRLRDDQERFRRYYLKTVAVIAALGMGLGAVLTVTGQDLVLMVLGPRWREAGVIFVASAPGIGVLLLSRAHGWLHVSVGRADRLLAWTLVVPVLTMLSLLMGLPYGPVGVAIAYSASSYVLFMPGIWFAAAPINLKWTSVLAVIWRYFIAALIAAPLCWYVLHRIGTVTQVYSELNVLARVVSASGFCTAAYMTLVVVLHGSVAPLAETIGMGRDLLPRHWGRARQ
jgi:PST family polysaccharide transporter